LKTGKYSPRPSVETIANAMDVGSPSNFDRILDLFGNSHSKISEMLNGYRYSDSEIMQIIRKVYSENGYLCDPHGACAYQALEEYLSGNQVGVFLETAHPAKFTETMENILGKGIVPLPLKLASFIKGKKESAEMNNNYDEFREFLMKTSSL
jgi:threonine synthase